MRNSKKNLGNSFLTLDTNLSLLYNSTEYNERFFMYTEVYCTLQIEGTHNWPDCPFEEVDYLRVPHRHVFPIKAYQTVTHSDRDVEFIMLKHRIQKHFVEKYWTGWKKKEEFSGSALCEFGAMSCEMIAQELIEHFNLSRCEVSEDNENGAVVSRNHP